MSKIKIPTYTMLGDMPKEMQEVVKERGLIEINPSFNTRYMLTYGTLRWGLGNWKWCLQGKTKHIGTFEMKGYLKNKGLACQYTGNPDHSTVMDLFEIIVETKDYFDVVNSDADGLEGVYWEGAGGYKSTAVHMKYGGEDIIAKFYNFRWTEKEIEKSYEDHAFSTYKTWVKSKETNTRSAGWLKYLQKEAPTAWEFFSGKKKTYENLKLVKNNNNG